MPSDSETVRKLAEHQFVVDVRPDLSDRDAAAKPFWRLIAEHSDLLRSKYGGAHHSSGALRSSVLHAKMDYTLFRVLQQEGIAQMDGRAVRMHPRLGGAYLTALAQVMARNRGLHPIADGIPQHLAAADLSTSRLAAVLLGDERLAVRSADQTEIPALMVGMALQYVLPTDIESVSVEEIIAFREKYRGERQRLHEHVEQLVGDLGSIGDVKNIDALQLHLEAAYERSLLPELQDLEKRLKAARIETVRSVFNLQAAVPPALAAALGLTGIAEPVALAGAGLALGLWGVLRSSRGARDRAVRESPIAYLYHAGQGFSAEGLTTELVRWSKSLPLRS
jgi:hypothetical protein